MIVTAAQAATRARVAGTDQADDRARSKESKAQVAAMPMLPCLSGDATPNALLAWI